MTLEGYKRNAEIDNGAEVGTTGKKLTVTWTTTKSVKKKQHKTRHETSLHNIRTVYQHTLFNCAGEQP